MPLAAGDQIAGPIKSVKQAAKTTHVTIEVSPTVTLTNEAADVRRLNPVMRAFAVVKASDVIFGV
jgi:molybdopterin-binding protein